MTRDDRILDALSEMFDKGEAVAVTDAVTVFGWVDSDGDRRWAWKLSGACGSLELAGAAYALQRLVDSTLGREIASAD